MNTTSIPLIGAIILGLAAAVTFAFPAAANEGETRAGAGVSLDANTTLLMDEDDGSASSTAEANADASVSTKGETKTTSSGPFTILRSSLSADSTADTAPKSSASVSSDADLSAYATAALREDAHLDAVSFENGSVEVSYYEQGRLVGIFPVTMKAKAKVASDGTVTVSYPWYRFLVASEDTNANVEAALESRIAAWRADASTETVLTASAKAELMDEIRSSLTATADASVR